MKFRKKPVVIEATQWLRNGDHPADDAGSYRFHGEDGMTDADNAIKASWNEKQRISFIIAWAPLPLPSVPTEIVGEVETS